MLYNISSKVIKGDGYGRKIGFPTVNLARDFSKEKEFPPDGVYAGTALLDSVEYRAGIVIGPLDKVEAHLIGYAGDAYGKEVTLQIKKFIRDYKKFNTEQELIIQIKKDMELC